MCGRRRQWWQVCGLHGCALQQAPRNHPQPSLGQSLAQLLQHCRHLGLTGFQPWLTSELLSEPQFLHLSNRDKVITNDIIRRNSLAQSRPLINVSCLLDQKYWISREAGSSTMSAVPGWECAPGTCPHPASSLRDTQLLSPITTPTTGGTAQASGPGNSLHPRRRALSCPHAKNSQQGIPDT